VKTAVVLFNRDRRYLPEPEPLEGRAIFRPWQAQGFERLGYPAPIVDHEEAAAELRAARG
jgi:deoxyribodipyrimidine photolyase